MVSLTNRRSQTEPPRGNTLRIVRMAERNRCRRLLTELRSIVICRPFARRALNPSALTECATHWWALGHIVQIGRCGARALAEAAQGRIDTRAGVGANLSDKSQGRTK